MSKRKIYHKTDEIMVYVVSSNYFVKFATQVKHFVTTFNIPNKFDASKKLQHAIEKSKPHPLGNDLINSLEKSLGIV